MSDTGERSWETSRATSAELETIATLFQHLPGLSTLRFKEQYDSSTLRALPRSIQVLDIALAEHSTLRLEHYVPELPIRCLSLARLRVIVDSTNKERHRFPHCAHSRSREVGLRQGLCANSCCCPPSLCGLRWRIAEVVLSRCLDHVEQERVAQACTDNWARFPITTAEGDRLWVVYECPECPGGGWGGGARLVVPMLGHGAPDEPVVWRNTSPIRSRRSSGLLGSPRSYILLTVEHGRLWLL